VENGADAIYFGLDRFNARMRAHNFTETDLPALMEFLHRRGVRGYVTFNTLVFPDELAEAEPYLRAIIAAGVDAAIVQDVGICRLIRQLSPDFPIHGSTQMTVTSAAGVEFVRDLGCQLIVLARECSIKEIERIHAETTERGAALPLEVFVHGALCVAYSGQCLTSEALGGRSANRGECAQACRMPYDLIADGRQVALGDRRYLLSPQDLSGLGALPDLARSGVVSLKIEGRLKSPEYVASITRVYRAALDQLERPAQPLTAAENRDDPAAARYELEMGFSRGLFTGWLGGIDNQRLVHARFGKKRGVFLGEVERVRGERVFVDLQASLKPGDGVVFDAGRPDAPEEGGRVYAIQPQREADGRTLTALSFGRGRENGGPDLSRIRQGDKLWKTSDPELDRRLRQSFAGDAPRFQRPIRIETHGHAGAPLTVIARDELGHAVRAESAMPLTAAEQRPLRAEQLASQLGRLGGTPFKLGGLDNHLEGDLILPISELNRLRRDVTAQLESLRAQPKRWTLRERETAPAAEIAPPVPAIAAAGEAQLIVLARTMGQLDAAIESQTAIIYCDFEDPKAYREAVRRVRAISENAEHLRPSVYVAPPRIFKPGEDWILKLVRSSDADGYLVRNYDHLRYFAGERCVGDFSLNVANALSARHFMERGGLERLTASYDLNAAQLESLLRSAPPSWFEVTIHQHMPMFHMEHCVFCAFLSEGTDYRNCGRPCDKQEVRLRDRVGLEHPLKADAGCRNTVFNARAQTGAESVERLMSLGLRHLRVEFVNETPQEVAAVLSRYRALLRGEITGAQLWRELKLQNQLGVTRGQMEQDGARKVFPRAR
jgi:putative protease